MQNEKEKNYDGKIKSVAEYIGIVKELCEKIPDKKTVFRGEQKIYGKSSFPNLFRDNYKEKRRINEQFELNILNIIRSEGFDDDSSYLLTAIEAQHGGFPSRLLDVSFNCLIALHFAVTPHFNSEITAYDDEDGQVVLIDVCKMISPASKQLEELYYDLISNSEDHFMSKYPIYAYEHLIIDYYRKNRRIEAQQGGFILFPGKHFRALPESIISRIIVGHDSKASIRRELNDLFGINNTFVYPEISNYPARALENSKYYSDGSFYKEKDILENIELNIFDNLDYFYNEVCNQLYAIANDSKDICYELYEETIREMLDFIDRVYEDMKHTLNLINIEKKDSTNLSLVHESFVRIIKKINQNLNEISNESVRVSKRSTDEMRKVISKFIVYNNFEEEGEK